MRGMVYIAVNCTVAVNDVVLLSTPAFSSVHMIVNPSHYV